MTSPILTSCTKDGGDDPAPVEDTKPVATIMDYSLTVGSDMMNYLDLTVEYYDATGIVQSEQMKQATWTKKVKAALPATLGVRLKIQLKSGVDTSGLDKFTESYSYLYEVYPVNASEKALEGGKSGRKVVGLDFQGEKLAEWVQRHANGLTKFLCVIDVNGQVSSGSWE